MLFTTLVNRLDNLSQSLTISTQKLFVSILNLHHPIISTLFLSCSTSTISIASSLSSFLSQLTQVVSSTTANINTYNSLSSLVKIFTQLHTNLPVDDSDPVTLSVLQYMKDADYHYSYHQFAFSNANYDSTVSRMNSLVDIHSFCIRPFWTIQKQSTTLMYAYPLFLTR